ncbi:MAG TPA: thioredoxin domain-containing protein [Candidatus Binatia bacterium]|nr:thioredoxin domain-containing protein [Candidatus Binatia bacterium]
MKRTAELVAILAVATASLGSLGRENVVLNYQGKLRAEGRAFSGTGHFMFVLENQSGEILWSSGDFPFAGSTNNPSNALAIPVQQGLYGARLGDTTLGMPALNLAGLRLLLNPRLKIWFNDGRHGWQRAGEDVPLENLSASLAEAGKRTITTAQADAILEELHQVHTLLERQKTPAPQAPPPPTFATVMLAGPGVGRADAPVVLVEFTDYQCPYCKKFHDSVLPELARKFVDTGKLRLVSRNLPLSFHQHAEPAARAALCAAQQDKYWPMREALFARSADLSLTNILRAAQAGSLDMAKFQTCLDSKTLDAGLKQDGLEASAAGISGTPSFVLGKPDGDKLKGLVIIGAQPLATFEAEIQKLLAAK